MPEGRVQVVMGMEVMGMVEMGMEVMGMGVMVMAGDGVVMVEEVMGWEGTGPGEGEGALQIHAVKKVLRAKVG